MNQRPTLFLSYLHDDEEHTRWVRRLAYDLRVSGGVDVWLDQWSASLGGNVDKYMEKGLNETKMVLCVCTEDFVNEANHSEDEMDIGNTIISKVEDNDKKYIIPLIRNNSNKLLPESIKDIPYQDFSHDDNYTICYWNLLDRIWEEDLRQIPPVGENPFYDEFASKIGGQTHVEITEYSNPEMTGEVTLNYDYNRGKFVIGRGNYSFTTQWGGYGRDTIHAYNYPEDIKLIGHKQGVNDIPPDKKDIENNNFDFLSSDKQVKINEIIIWLNMQGKLAATKVTFLDRRKQILKFKYKIY